MQDENLLPFEANIALQILQKNSSIVCSYLVQKRDFIGEKTWISSLKHLPYDVEILNGSHWMRIFIDGVEIEWKGFIVTIEVAMGIFERCGWDDGVPRGQREEVPLCWASVAEEDLWSKVSLLVTIDMWLMMIFVLTMVMVITIMQIWSKCKKITNFGNHQSL